MKDYNYFGLQHGDQCLCGNDDSNIVPTHSFECNIKCSGHDQQLCGGFWRVNIYTTSNQNSIYSTCKFTLFDTMSLVRCLKFNLFFYRFPSFF